MFKKPNSAGTKSKREKHDDAIDEEPEVVIKKPRLNIKEEVIDVYLFILLFRRKNKKDYKTKKKSKNIKKYYNILFYSFYQRLLKRDDKNTRKVLYLSLIFYNSLLVKKWLKILRLLC